MQKTVVIELSNRQYQDITRALIAADYSEIKEDGVFANLMLEAMQSITKKVFVQLVDDVFVLELTKGEAGVLSIILRRVFQASGDNYPLLGSMLTELGKWE